MKQMNITAQDFQSAIIGIGPVLANETNLKWIWVKDEVASINLKTMTIRVHSGNPKTEEGRLLFRLFTDHECLHGRYDRSFDVDNFLSAYPVEEKKARFNFINVGEDIKNDFLGVKEFPGMKEAMDYGSKFRIRTAKECLDKKVPVDPINETTLVLILLNFGYTEASLWELSEKTKEWLQKIRDAGLIKISDKLDNLENAKHMMMIFDLLKKEMMEEKKKKKEEKKKDKQKKKDDKGKEEKEKSPSKDEKEEGEDNNEEESEENNSGSEDENESEGDNKEDESNKEKDEKGEDDKSSSKDGDEGDDKEENKKEEKDDEGESNNESEDEEDDLTAKEIMDKIAESIAKDSIKENLKMELDRTPNNDSYRPFRGGDKAIVPDMVDPVAYNVLKNSVGSKISIARNRIREMLISSSRDKFISNREEGDLDTDLCPVMGIARLTKDKAFFSQKISGRSLNTSVELLIDLSGSMSSSGKLKAAQKLTIVLGEILNACKIPFEIIGHNTGYEPFKPENPIVNGQALFNRMIPQLYYIYKTFGESYNSIRNRLSNMNPGGANTDGEAVELCLNRLKIRTEKRKVLFVLSDGLPTNGETPTEIVCRHLKETIQKGRKSGIEIYSFGIMTDAPREFYGEKYNLTVNNVNEIGPVFLNKMAKILKLTNQRED